MLHPRKLLAVARPAELPTVWSNCLAGWWLGGAGHLAQLPFLFASASLFYFGGVFLNDAFDADFDREHHPSRPVPSGSISQDSLWRGGVALLVIAGLLLLPCGLTAGTLGLLLVLCIILYNALNRVWHVAPLLRGLCRLLLYGLGAAVAERGVTGWAIWCGVAAGAYISGVGYFSHSRLEAKKPHYWSLLLLAVPIVLALLMDVGIYRESGLLLAALLVLWILRSLRQTLWSLEPNLKATIAGLMAGIVFVDWLATCPINVIGQSNRAGQQISIAFLALFALTLLLQKFVPEE